MNSISYRHKISIGKAEAEKSAETQAEEDDVNDKEGEDNFHPIITAERYSSIASTIS